MDQSEVSAVEKIAATQTEDFFMERRIRSDREAFRRILNRDGGEVTPAGDRWENAGPN